MSFTDDDLKRLMAFEQYFYVKTTAKHWKCNDGSCDHGCPGCILVEKALSIWRCTH